MTIFEFQKLLTDDLNGTEKLLQSGCKAFAEDTRTVYNESEQFVSSGGVALVVVTPRRLSQPFHVFKGYYPKKVMLHR